MASCCSGFCCCKSVCFGRDAASLSNVISSGAIKLLGGKWLVAQADDWIIQRCQDIPKEGFVPSKDAAWKVTWIDTPISDSMMVGVVVLSYPWLTKDHPDPFAFHARKVRGYLKKHIALCEMAATNNDCMTFWDFASLPQMPRTERESNLFKQGIKAINLLYGHRYTVVIQSTKMPEPCVGMELNLTAYFDRGWCFFEATASSLTKHGIFCLDIGAAEKEVLDEQVDWHELSRKATAGRMPPLAPEDMEKELAKRTFTNKADFSMVAGIYERFFNDVAGRAQKLNFNNYGESVWAGWADDDIAQLARALPSFKKCQGLALGSHSFGEAGLASLQEAVVNMPALKVLGLPRQLQDKPAANALKEAWIKSGKSEGKPDGRCSDLTKIIPGLYFE